MVFDSGLLTCVDGKVGTVENESWIPEEMWTRAVDNENPEMRLIQDSELGTLAYVMKDGDVVAIGHDEARQWCKGGRA
jgi:hypothetical protein